MLDEEVLSDLYYAYQHRKRRIALSIAGKSAPKPRRGSIQDAWSPGHVLYRAVTSAKAYLQPDEGSFATGTVDKGSYYASLEKVEGWIRIKSSGSPSAMMYYQDAMQGWVKSVLEIVDKDPMAELVNIETAQGENVFDKPFVPRLDAGKGADLDDKSDEKHHASLCAKFSFKAKDAFERGKFLMAAELYTNAIEAAGTTKREKAIALGYRAGCYRRARKLDEALADCDDSLCLFPSHDEVLFRKGAIYLEKEYRRAQWVL